MTNYNTSLWLALGVCCLVQLGMNASASAQMGVGTLNPDRNVALHVKAQTGQNPIRLEGLTTGTTETNILVADDIGTIRYRPVSDLSTGGAGEWSNHTSDLYIFANRANAASNSVVVTDNGRIGIGITDPQSAFHISQSLGTATPVSLKIQNSSNQGSAQLEFIEGPTDPTNGMRIRYNSAADGSSDGLEITNGSGNVLTRVDRTSGNMGIGIIPSNSTANPRLQVNGDVRIEGSNELQLRDLNTRQFRIGASYVSENNAGGPAYHLAPSYMIGTPLNNFNTTLIAFFNPLNGRVGIGPRDYFATPPQATVDILATGTDNPLRIVNMDDAPNGNNYRTLIIDNNGVVYKARRNVNQSGFNGDNSPSFSLREDQHLTRMVIPEELTAIGSIEDVLGRQNTRQAQTGSENTVEISPEAIKLESSLSVLNSDKYTDLEKDLNMLKDENAAISKEVQLLKSCLLELQGQLKPLLEQEK